MMFDVHLLITIFFFFFFVAFVHASRSGFLAWSRLLRTQCRRTRSTTGFKCARLRNVFCLIRVSDSTRTVTVPVNTRGAHATYCSIPNTIIDDSNIRCCFFAGICTERKELSSARRGDGRAPRPIRPRKRVLVHGNRFDDAFIHVHSVRTGKRYNLITASIVGRRRMRSRANNRPRCLW